MDDITLKLNLTIGNDLKQHKNMHVIELTINNNRHIRHLKVVISIGIQFYYYGIKLTHY